MEDSAELQAIDQILSSEGPQAVFNDRFIGDKFCERIAHKLRGDVVKTDVQLRGNYIACSGGVSLADMLRTNSTIRSLSLEWNDIGTYDLAVASLAGALEVNRTLRVLDMRNNHISADGAVLLARALKVNDTLQTLDLRWNEVGDVGAEALFHVLHHNKTIRDLRLAGNKVSESLLCKVEGRVQGNAREADGQGAHHGANTQHELQATRTRIAELEGELMKRRHEEDETASVHKLQEEKASVALQLEGSASRVVSLEHDLLVAQGNNAELKARLEAEVAARQRTEELLRESKAAMEELMGREERQQHTIQALNDERRDLQQGLKEAKSGAEDMVAQARAGEKERVTEAEAAKAEAAKLAQALRTAEATILQLRGKLTLVGGQLDEERSAVDRIQDATRVQLEEMRGCYEERLKALKQDLERRAKTAEDRLMDSESERRRLSAAKEALQRELSKTQLEVEERLCEQENRLRSEVETRHEADVQEMSDRIAALTRSRELQESAALLQSQALEELKIRLSADGKDHAKTSTQLRGEVERVREELRTKDATLNKLQVEMMTHEQKVSVLQMQRAELEKDRVRLEAGHREALDMVKDAYEQERKALLHEVENGRQRTARLEEQVGMLRTKSALVQQQAARSLASVERDVVAFVQQAVSVELSKQQGMGSKGEEGEDANEMYHTAVGSSSSGKVRAYT